MFSSLLCFFSSIANRKLLLDAGVTHLASQLPKVLVVLRNFTEILGRMSEFIFFESFYGLNMMKVGSEG